MQRFAIKLHQNTMVETNQCPFKVCLLKMFWFYFVKTIFHSIVTNYSSQDGLTTAAHTN